MDNRIIGFALSSLLVGGLVGWMLSDTDTPEVSDNDVWQSFETSLAGRKSVFEMAQNIKASGIIREFLTQAERAAAAAVIVEEDGIPPLPEIIGTSVVNGTAQVHLKMIDDRPIALTQGEALENGWILKTVNLNGVVFQYEDTERTVMVKEYDLTPEQTSDDNTSGEKENVEQ